MAKVDTIEFHINGSDFKSNINVGKAGIFKCELQWQVAQAIGVESPVESQKLAEVQSIISTAYMAFLDAKTETFAWIMINYAGSGVYKNGMDSKFHTSGFSGDPGKLEFGFKIYIQEKHHTGTSSWWTARRGNPERKIDAFDESKGYEDANELIKDRNTFNVSIDNLIPYTAEAYDTLDKAEKALANISEQIYNFVSQDKAALIQSLNSGKLLE